MKLVFYGGGQAQENVELDRLMLKLILKKREDIVVTYVPFSGYESEIYFQEFVSQYRKFGINRFMHFPVDIDHGKYLLDEVFNADIIHLSGGNTFYFLKHIRKKEIFLKLKEFVERGGILTGLSAGGIIMTPNIFLASYPGFDRDENEVRIRNLKALNLVNFEFFPHFKNSKRYNEALKQYSKQINNPIYACKDGSGIIIDEKNRYFSGKVFKFEKGKRIVVH